MREKLRPQQGSLWPAGPAGRRRPAAGGRQQGTALDWVQITFARPHSAPFGASGALVGPPGVPRAEPDRDMSVLRGNEGAVGRAWRLAAGSQRFSA